MSALALPPSSQAEPESAPQQGTQASWGQTKSFNNWGKTGATVGVALIGVAAIGALIWFFSGHGRGGTVTAAASVSSNVETASATAASASVAVPAPGNASSAPVAAAEPSLVASQAAVVAAKPSSIELVKPAAASDGKTSSKPTKGRSPTGSEAPAPAVHPSTSKKPSAAAPTEPATKGTQSSSLGGRI